MVSRVKQEQDRMYHSRNDCRGRRGDSLVDSACWLTPPHNSDDVSVDVDLGVRSPVLSQPSAFTSPPTIPRRPRLDRRASVLGSTAIARRRLYSIGTLQPTPCRRTVSIHHPKRPSLLLHRQKKLWEVLLCARTFLHQRVPNPPHNNGFLMETARNHCALSPCLATVEPHIV